MIKESLLPTYAGGVNIFSVKNPEARSKISPLFVLLQADFIQDCGPVCDTGLYLDFGSVPDQSFLSGHVHHSQLPARHLPLRRPLSAQQRGRLQLDLFLVLLFSHNMYFSYLIIYTRLTH